MFVSLFVCSINSFASSECMLVRVCKCIVCVCVRWWKSCIASVHRFTISYALWSPWMWHSSSRNGLEPLCAQSGGSEAWPRHYWHLYAKKWFENVERCGTFFGAMRFRYAPNQRLTIISEMQRFPIKTDWNGWRPCALNNIGVKCSREN